DPQRLVHELEVHQIELELQNAELSDARGALEESRARYVDLYEFAPVGYVTLAPDGVVREMNLAAATLVLSQPRHHAVNEPLDRVACARDPVSLRAHLRECVLRGCETSFEF